MWDPWETLPEHLDDLRRTDIYTLRRIVPADRGFDWDQKHATIITRSPLRITLGGGGTDLPSYYREHGGFLIAAAIDKYVYVTVMRPFIEGIFLKYSRLEHVEQIDEVQHPIIREALPLDRLPHAVSFDHLTLADIPAGTGLGSSGSFATALLKALYAHRRRLLHPSELAALACDIEINMLGEPVEKEEPETPPRMAA